jgi:transposase
MVYVGMDVHRKRTQVAVLRIDGTEVLNRSVSNSPEELIPVLGSLQPGTPVAFEAAYGWGWVVETLDELGHEAHLVHPSRCKAIASARLKNDKVDARTIAHLLRTDLLPEAWIAPSGVRDQRTLLRMRVSLVRVRTAFKNRIQAVLADAGVQPTAASPWTRSGRSWLEGLALSETQRAIIDSSLKVIDDAQIQIDAFERRLRAAAQRDPRVAALTAVYGIGTITAMTIVAEVGEVTRFPTSRKLCAWAGLTPNVRNSSDRVKHGHISKQGSRFLRWALIEAAHKAKTKPPLRADFDRIARRRGKNIATVAIARKLLTRCFFLLKESS